MADEMRSFPNLVTAICAIGVSGNRDALTALIRVIDAPPDDINWSEKITAMAALVKLKAEAKPAIPVLKRLAAKQGNGLHTYAERTLQAINDSN
jgi:hypothetical protein